MPLYAGVCETDITPPLGVWMAGYAGRSTGAIGVHDPLYARALVLDNGTRRLALVAMDLIALDADLVTRVREAVAAQLVTTPDAVMLHCTHTHAGPYVKSYRCMGHRDDAYIDVLARKLIGITRQAADYLQPVALTYGESAAQIGVNRRRSLSEGRTVLGVDYAGPVAPIVQTLSVQSVDGRTLALLFCHACHPTTLGGENLQFSAEWPGAAVTHLKRLIQKGGEESGWAEEALPFCLQGCCGDINPVRRGSWEAVTSNGIQVGSAAHTARWNAHGRLEETLDVQETTLELPLLPPPSMEECDRMVEEAISRLERARQSGADRGRILLEEGMLEWAQAMRTVAGHPDAGETQSFAIQRLTLGGVHLLGFPAEMFVQYQRDFSKQCRAPVLSLSYTNGCWNYVPTAAEYARGGYEVEGAYKYYGTQMFAPDCEALIRAAVYRLLNIGDPDLTPYSLRSD